MIVVSDTTPIHYLILIGKDSILPGLFSEIIIPDVVLWEMSHPNAPAAVRDWAADKPDWAVTKSGSESFLHKIKGLGKGETSAIAIAIEVHADAILMDDRRAIREAVKNGLNILSTFALLELAAAKNLIDFAKSIEELSKRAFTSRQIISSKIIYFETDSAFTSNASLKTTRSYTRRNKPTVFRPAYNARRELRLCCV